MTFSRGVLVFLFSLALAVWLAPAPAMGDTVSVPGVFSFQAPKGWTARDTAFSKYPMCFDAPKNGFAPNINVVMESVAKTLDEYVAMNKIQLKNVSTLQNVVIVDEMPCQTARGLNGTRIVITDTVGKFDLEQTFYFFDGASDAKYVVTASCLVGDAQKYAPLFEQVMLSFSPK